MGEEDAAEEAAKRKGEGGKNTGIRGVTEISEVPPCHPLLSVPAPGKRRKVMDC